MDSKREGKGAEEGIKKGRKGKNASFLLFSMTVSKT